MSLTAVINSAELLVRRCLDGDVSAYRLLYDRYSKAMYNTALRIVNSAADAEDILQEAFTDAFLQLKSFENKSTFGAWLKQIVVYKSINFLKKKRISFLDMENTGDMPDTGEEETIWYTVDTIKASIKELPDGYRTVLSLSLFEGYDHEEIAETLGLAHSTVRSQYIRGKQKLITLLKIRAAHEQ
ncbi:MAG: sigma-70 family RNA polymerase sigma factor [Bacteroidetes bacterium]|nr:MAG: sigma-70 family RNA polymerase sigma factor [Bacteroidota bacterium]